MMQTTIATDSFAGLYVHVPFCLKKCRYCDFFSVPEIARIPDFVSALKKEIELSGRQHEDLIFDTIYLGGGTPSLLSPGQLEEILAALRKSFCFAPETRVSMEANPGTVSAQTLRDFRGLGVSRINLGVQSFDDGALAFLGRVHDGKQACDAFSLCREAGFDEIGADLILAIPGRSMKTLRNDLGRMLSFLPEHMSCYLLSFEPKTPLGLAADRGEVKPVSDDRAAADYLFAHWFLNKNGYRHYEVSNWSLGPDHLSSHNVKYWQGSPYVGLGPSAHSFKDGRRWANAGNLSDYFRGLSQDRLPVAHEEKLKLNQQMLEHIFLRLRRDTGFGLLEFSEKFRVDASSLWESELRALVSARLARWDGETIFLRPKGMLVLDAVVRRIASLAGCLTID